LIQEALSGELWRILWTCPKTDNMIMVVVVVVRVMMAGKRLPRGH
jgi:hypothetical protein